MSLITIAYSITSICSGILLAMGLLDKWDGEKDFFKKIGNFLIPYNTIIGGIILGIGILYFGSLGIIKALLAIAAGLLLLTGILSKTPAIGNLLEKVSKAIIPFKVTIGLASLAFGILSILKW